MNIRSQPGSIAKQTGVVRNVAVLPVGSVFQQHFHHILSAATARQRQGGVLGPFGLSFNIRAMLNQSRHDCGVTSRG